MSDYSKIVEILIKLNGDQNAKATLESLIRLRDDLSSKKIELQFSANRLKDTREQIEREIKALENRKIRLTTDNDAWNRAMSQIKLIQAEIDRNNLAMRRAQPGDDLSYYRQRNQELREARLREVDNRNAIEESINGVRSINRELAQQKALKNELYGKEKDAAKDQRDLELAYRAVTNEIKKQEHAEKEAADAAIQAAETRRQAEERASRQREEYARREEAAENARRARIEAQNALYREQATAIGEIAKAIESIGNASRWTEQFAIKIGTSFSEMAKLFNVSAFETVAKTLTEMATEALVGDMSRITSRYDIMSTFTDYMKMAGASADEAADALQRVNDSILGLPIGLDESAQRLRRYQMFLGDLGQATNLTIGLQKAIYAGGASEQMRNQSFYQIDRLLTVGELNTARQWNALIQGLGVSVRYIAEELGYSINSVDEFAGMLSTGVVSVDKFLGALQSLGAGGSEAAKKLDSALGIYKGTLESWLSNIQFAAVRGGTNVLNALNDVLTTETGEGLTGYLEKSRDAINDIYKGIGDWIKTNPQEITNSIDAFERLFNAIGRFSASNIATAVFDNLARGINYVADAINKLPTENVEEFVSFATTFAGPLGKIFEAAAAGFGKLVGVFERFKDFDFEALIDSIISKIEILAKVTEGLLNLIPDSVMREIISYGLVFGGPVADAFGTLGKAIGELAVALSALSIAGFGPAQSLLNALGEAANVASTGILKTGAAATTTGAAVTKLSSALDVGGAAARSAGSAASASATGFAAIAPAIAGVILAVGALVAIAGHAEAKFKEAFNDAYGDLVNDAEAAVRSAESVSEAYEQTQQTLRGELTESAAKAREVQRLLGELKTNDTSIRKGDMSAEEGFRRQTAVIRQLDTVWANHGITLDKETGSYDKNSRAIVNNAEAMAKAVEKEKRAAAYSNALEKAYQNKFDAERKLENLEAERLRLLEAINGEESKTVLADYNGDGILDSENAFGRGATSILNEDLQSVEEQIEEMRRVYAAASGDVIHYSEQSAAAIGEVEDAVDEATAAIYNYQNAFRDAKTDAKEFLDEAFSGFEESGKVKGNSLGSMKENLISQKEALEQYYKNLNWLAQYYSRNKDFRGTTLGQIGIEIVEGKDREELASLVNELKEEEKRRKTDPNAKSETLKAIVSAYESRESLKDLADDSYAYIVTDQTLDKVAGAAQKATEDYQPNDKFLLKMTGLDEASVEAAKEKAVQAAGEIAEAIAGEEALEGFQPKDNLLLKAMGGEDAADVINGDDDTSLTASLEAADSFLKEMADVSVPALEESIGALAEQETVLTSAVENVRSATHTAIFDVIRALEDLMLKITAVRIRAQTEFPLVVAEIDKVKKAVEELIQTLSELVNTSWHFSVTGDLPGSMPELGPGGEEAATGGLIDGGGRPKYFASGGFVFMKPRGTDTVPAMLTPGEYVMRKGAVDRLGAPFLQRLNHLDIAGALDNLMHRFYRPSSAAYSVVNNSADNRAYNVNVYNYGATEDYTYHVAARFARAL